MGLEFRVLGPLEVHADGQLLQMGPPQQRLVVAALALDAGRLVTTQTLIDRVWDQAPDGARRTLHVLISRIRRVLGHPGPADPCGRAPARVARRSGGYVLDVPADWVDAHRFRRLTDRARDPDHSHGVRVELLREAVALWRGEPLAGLRGRWAADTRRAWQQQRLDTVTAWAQAELQVGNPTAVVGPLTALAGEYPLAESLVVVLMQALAGCGRPADALLQYAATRRRLDDELGADPGPQLRAVHQQILRSQVHPNLIQATPTPARPAAPLTAVAWPPAHSPALAAAARSGTGRDRLTRPPRPHQNTQNAQDTQVLRGCVVGDATGPAAQAPLAGSQPGQGHLRPVPAQLPAAVSAFAGRRAELAILDALVDPAGADAATRAATTVVISAIAGTAGVGKTALAVHWAHQVAHRFPDGQLYVNLRGFDPGGQVMDPAQAVRGFLDALDVPAQRIPADLDAQAALYRSLLAERRLLVLIDNARDPAQVRPLLPGAPGCLVVVTSRNHLAGLVAADGAHPITLDLLTPAEARQLLAHRLGPDRTAAEPDAVEEIVTRCARLPLALAVLSARAATHPQLPLRSLADDLREARDRLDALAGDDAQTDVRAVFSWSYQALTPPAARLFRLLGLHPGPDITTPAAASLTGLPPPQVRPLLTELTRASLILEHTPGRYTHHDLLRAYATHLTHTTDPSHQRHAATGRMLDHYLHTARTADRALYPARDPITLTPPRPGVTPEQPGNHQQAMAWFTAEHAVLLGSLDHAAATDSDTHAWQLGWALWTFLHLQGHWHDQTTAQRAALAAAQRLADPAAQAHAHRNLASAHTWLGHLDAAGTHLRHALDLFGQAGDLTGQAWTHLSLSFVWGRRGDHTEALDHDWHALSLFQASGHLRGQAHALNGIGWGHAILGDHQRALSYCHRALTLHEGLGDPNGQASTWDSLGYAHLHLGHHSHALTCYHHALDLLRDLGDRHGQATTWDNLGDTHHAAGNSDAARTAWQHALTILTDLDHPDADHLHTKLTTPPTTTAAPLNQMT